MQQKSCSNTYISNNYTFIFKHTAFCGKRIFFGIDTPKCVAADASSHFLRVRRLQQVHGNEGGIASFPWEWGKTTSRTQLLGDRTNQQATSNKQQMDLVLHKRKHKFASQVAKRYVSRGKKTNKQWIGEDFNCIIKKETKKQKHANMQTCKQVQMHSGKKMEHLVHSFNFLTLKEWLRPARCQHQQRRPLQ